MKTTTKKDIKKCVAFLMETYYTKASNQVFRKGLDPSVENIVIEMINMHFKRKAPLRLTQAKLPKGL